MGNKTIKMMVVLTATSVLAGGVLAAAYLYASPKIEANRLEDEKKAIFAVLKDAASYETITKEIQAAKGVETIRIFKGLDASGNVVGYAFIAEGPGFSATIKMMVGLNLDYKRLAGMKVVEQLETPGLGTKIAEEKFEGQFRGLAIEPKIEYLKNKKPDKENQIQAIAGATISSRAVVEAINKRVGVVIDMIRSGEGGNG